jgi:hypothetical protein
MIGTVGSRYAREDKKTGIFGYKRFRVPVNKASLFKFHDVECSTRDCGARRGGSGSVSSHLVTFCVQEMKAFMKQMWTQNLNYPSPEG